ncbi:hypothetical protein AAC03nite_03270 [Alicyclobacillus acidoterrestris]|uniref:DUF58 domain-containing protein n=1 Tax=Alicyclobacillus suci TaxID=2816080 RepID=UPI001197F46F|nr:DUF58 domain-containing protein [Alicyclobacillus suci]GEO24542.1 hypothetical protein AAC03nite_03270 [Alicyclobacillus acidoterrestris]
MRVRVGLTALMTVLVMGGLFYFGMVTGGFFAWFLFYFCLALAAYEWLTLSASLVGMRVQRHVSAHRLTAGQSLQVRVLVERQAMWPLFWLRIHEQLPYRWLFQTSGLDRIHVPLWRRAIDYGYTVYQLPRGVYELMEMTVETGDLLGFVRVHRTFAQPERIIVYPKVVPVRGWAGTAPDEYGERQPTHRRSEESSNVIGVREFVRGDKLNRIHWPMTARRGMLLAKEFEQHVTSEFMFIPDNTTASYTGDAHGSLKFDVAMSITASLIRNAYDNHRKFGMVVPADAYLSFPAGLDGALLARCLEALAAMQPQSPRDILSFLQRIADDANRGTLFVVVSPRLDQPMAVALSHLMRQGRVQLFVPVTEERLTDAKRLGYERLSAAGIPVYLIRNVDQLSFLRRGGVSGATVSSH